MRFKETMNQNVREHWRAGLLGAIAATFIVSACVVGFKSHEPEGTPAAASNSATTQAQRAGSKDFTSGPLHENIVATEFWTGEAATEDNDYIQNRSSAWQDDWTTQFGGVDDPENRCGYKPCGFTPKENPFYFALPFNDYAANGNPKSADTLKAIPWYDGQPMIGTSLLKNRWVEITGAENKKAYAQWEDVGPFGENDVNYVFGSARPQEKRAGIDLSPATADYLTIGGRGNVNWRFVDASQVPDGPWKETVTTSQLIYN